MVIKCPLCGYRFNSDLATACKGCPVSGNCDKICCPNCGYGWVESSSIVDSLRKFLKRKAISGKS
jgi:hypothetical protein